MPHWGEEKKGNFFCFFRSVWTRKIRRKFRIWFSFEQMAQVESIICSPHSRSETKAEQIVTKTFCPDDWSANRKKNWNSTNNNDCNSSSSNDDDDEPEKMKKTQWEITAFNVISALHYPFNGVSLAFCHILCSTSYANFLKIASISLVHGVDERRWWELRRADAGEFIVHLIRAFCVKNPNTADSNDYIV